MGKERPKVKRVDVGDGTLNLSGIGTPKDNGSGHGIPSLFHGAIERNSELEKRRKNITGSTVVAQDYASPRGADDFKHPISRTVVYGGICLASLGLGVVRGLYVRNNPDAIPGLESMLVYGTPIVGGILGFMHEAGVEGWDGMFDTGSSQIYGAAAGGIGAYLCERAGYLVGSLFS